MRLLAAFVLLVACHQDDPGPPCAQVVDHLLDVAKQQLTGHDTVQLDDRKQRIAHCEQHLSKAARACILAAKDLAGLADCARLEPRAPVAAPPAAGSSFGGKPTP